MIEVDTLTQNEIKEGFKARFVHTENLTLGYWDVEEGAILPMHAHFHEQVTQVLEGKFELTIGEDTKIYEKGQLAVIPPNMVHGGKALTKCKIFDIFCPVREDYQI
ncbi:cupin domain-containing protein [Flavobacterium sp. LT1R49]|uniref:cupin domain-containing protein n=1 Tax=Flavobacterium arabinosi TaxID=3398737 RepID=UPI003A8561BA